MIKNRFSRYFYIENLGDYIKIYTTEKTIVTRETISNIEAKLPNKDFICVYRSYLITLPKSNSNK